jgi:type VI protein secretion system component VasK
MNLLDAEITILPLLPLYFLARYLYKVRPHRRLAESWLWLILPNAVFAAILALGTITLFFGTTWPGRPVVRGLVFAIVIAVFGAQIAWLEYRLRTKTPELSRSAEGPTGESLTHMSPPIEGI